MSKYNYMREGGYVLECASCSSEAPLIESKSSASEKTRLLCEICYTTFVGNATEYPEQYDAPTAQIIAQVGNIILNAVTGRKP